MAPERKKETKNRLDSSKKCVMYIKKVMYLKFSYFQGNSGSHLAEGNIHFISFTASPTVIIPLYKLQLKPRQSCKVDDTTKVSFNFTVI